MKIEILVPDSGPSGTRNRGDIVDVGKKEATALIKAGRAQPVRAGEPPETTTAKPSTETAAAEAAEAAEAAVAEAAKTAKTAD